MAVSLQQIKQMVAQKRLRSADHALREMYAANPKVWGLQDEMDRLEEQLRIVEGLAEKANQLLDRTEISAAYPYLKKAVGIVVDDEAINDRKARAKVQIGAARQAAHEAGIAYQRGDFQQALRLAEEAEQADGTDAHSEFVAKLRSEIRTSNRSERIHRRGVAASVLVGLLCLAGVAATAWWSHHNAKVVEANESVVSEARNLSEGALALIEKEEFDSARTSLKQSVDLLNTLDGDIATELRDEVNQLLTSDRLTRGLKGQVLFDEQWVSVEERARELADRKQLRVQLGDLEKLIDEYLTGGVEGVAAAKAATRERYRPLLKQIRSARDDSLARRHDQARAKYVSAIETCDLLFRDSGLVKHEGQWMTAEAAEIAEMTAKGLVKYEDEWITKIEKTRREMTAKGLVLHGDKWVTPEKKKELEMTERGLVLYKGKWITASEKEFRENTDKGLVRFEGAWVTPQERDRTLRARREKLAPTAYRMSQVFIKDRLKAPRTAIFPDFSDRQVTVVMKDDGHFVVRAYVDSQNALGALLRAVYYIELWPTDATAENWRSNEPVIIQK